GFKGYEIMSKLFVAHQKGQIHKGIDVLNGDVIDSVDDKIFDLYLIKEWAIKLANNAATTVLRVDQIIMAKAAGGPKPKENKNFDED
ncbi:TCP-1/cpn60 chaperonin family protein, partial [Salmonella sp. s51228]|uniref:TCP-1/cpn60 chaperonin family protein n=1 Tax=Salmonella sp. s51228 TaxID=3159652 RepID=UPI00397F2F29